MEERHKSTRGGRHGALVARCPQPQESKRTRQLLDEVLRLGGAVVRPTQDSWSNGNKDIVLPVAYMTDLLNGRKTKENERNRDGMTHGIAEDEVANQLFSGLLIWSIFCNGI